MNATGWLETIGAPIVWRFYLISFGAMVTLAGLDMLGAVLAKEWVTRHHPVWFIAGLITFGILFASTPPASTSPSCRW